ncbi:MAG: hypothetical protein CMP76_04700 [Flavobacterium sp.]|uniref:hypothetical protein n=1 Tax=Flavobacterium sp. TaxID=239 RepID=UPI000C361F54|nr:hypothetical protein [Flavobacterium sp.]MBF02578.1 hypothetical protein [Flavobacterium sp.]|tara:strand:- start:128 stop:520 length:393 start_codon:yes stop_codon:yes gene_type:complete
MFLKLHIFKFLGKFIPYFRRKMNKDTMLRYVDNEVMCHMKDFLNISLYKISHNLVTYSNITNNQIKIEYKIEYRNIDFKIYMDYFENDLKIRFNGVLDCADELEDITSFFVHFRKINTKSLIHIFSLFRI